MNNNKLNKNDFSFIDDKNNKSEIDFINKVNNMLITADFEKYKEENLKNLNIDKVLIEQFYNSLFCKDSESKKSYNTKDSFLI